MQRKKEEGGGEKVKAYILERKKESGLFNLYFFLLFISRFYIKPIICLSAMCNVLFAVSIMFTHLSLVIFFSHSSVVLYFLICVIKLYSCYVLLQYKAPKENLLFCRLFSH